MHWLAGFICGKMILHRRYFSFVRLDRFTCQNMVCPMGTARSWPGAGTIRWSSVVILSVGSPQRTIFKHIAQVFPLRNKLSRGSVIYTAGGSLFGLCLESPRELVDRRFRTTARSRHRRASSQCHSANDQHRGGTRETGNLASDSLSTCLDIA